MEHLDETLEEKTTTPTSEPDVVEPTDKPKKKITLSKKTVTIAVIIVLVVVLGWLIYHFKGLVVASTVNGTPISRLSVVDELEKSAGKNTLEALINRQLINSEALKQNITVSQDEINTEIKTITDQLTTQGQKLDEVLKTEGMTQADLEKQITTQKKLEKLLADKTEVTDAEAEKYLADNKIEIPKGQEATYQEQAKTQLKQQKLSEEANALITSLRATAKIKYFVAY